MVRWDFRPLCIYEKIRKPCNWIVTVKNLLVFYNWNGNYFEELCRKAFVEIYILSFSLQHYELHTDM